MLTLLLVVSARRAAAGEPSPAASNGARSVDVVVDAPAGCTSSADLTARVWRLLRGSRREGSLVARASIVRVRDGLWTAAIQTRIGGELGERRLTAASCELLAEASALVLALAIDPELPVESPAAAPTPPPAPAPAPPPVIAAPVARPPVERASPAPSAPTAHLVAEAWLGAAAGSLPSAQPGAGLGAGIGHAWWVVEGTFGVWLGASATSPVLAGAGGTFQLLDLGVRACAHTDASISLGACAGAELEREQGVGYGVDEPGHAAAWWIAPTAGARIAVRPSQLLELPLGVEALVPLTRPTFALENVGTVFRPAAVAGRATLGAVVHFR